MTESRAVRTSLVLCALEWGVALLGSDPPALVVGLVGLG